MDLSRFKITYSIGQTVYLIHDSEQMPYVVTGILLRQHGFIFGISYGGEETYHYDFELSDKPNTKKMLGMQ